MLQLARPTAVNTISNNNTGGQIVVTWVGTSGADTKTGTSSADTLSGRAGNDTLKGVDGNDKLYGEGGADKLYGGNGADVLDGGLDGNTGIDYLEGGAGNDTYYANSGWDYGAPVDRVVELSGGGTDTVYHTGFEYSLPANVEKYVAQGSIGSYYIAGNGLANDMTGNADGNEMSGLAGNDILRGMDGADYLSGDDGNDALYGYEDDDWLSGENGNDTMRGWLGADNLRGDDGADKFWFDAVKDSSLRFTGTGEDKIEDFSRAQGDKIVFSATFDANTTVVGIQDPVWVGNDATSLSAGRMTVQTATVGEGDSSYQARFLVMDVDGGTDGDFRIELAGVTTLSNTDFTFL
jgi:Ca2+-binding RTX toxin-like protein